MNPLTRASLFDSFEEDWASNDLAPLTPPVRSFVESDLELQPFSPTLSNRLASFSLFTGQVPLSVSESHFERPESLPNRRLRHLCSTVPTPSPGSFINRSSPDHTRQRVPSRSCATLEASRIEALPSQSFRLASPFSLPIDERIHFDDRIEFLYGDDSLTEMNDEEDETCDFADGEDFVPIQVPVLNVNVDEPPSPVLLGNFHDEVVSSELVSFPPPPRIVSTFWRDFFEGGKIIAEDDVLPSGFLFSLQRRSLTLRFGDKVGGMFFRRVPANAGARLCDLRDWMDMSILFRSENANILFGVALPPDEWEKVTLRVWTRFDDRFIPKECILDELFLPGKTCKTSEPTEMTFKHQHSFEAAMSKQMRIMDIVVDREHRRRFGRVAFCVQTVTATGRSEEFVFVYRLAIHGSNPSRSWLQSRVLKGNPKKILGIQLECVRGLKRPRHSEGDDCGPSRKRRKLNPCNRN